LNVLAAAVAGGTTAAESCKRTSMAKTLEKKPAGYEAFIGEVKERIRAAQVGAALAVNRELVLLYWSIGRDILARQAEQGWGAQIIEHMAADLSQAFPTVTGFRLRNLRYMRSLAEAYPDPEFVQQVVAQLPWGHNVRVLDQIKDAGEREWYLRQAVQNGWSRNVLIHQIESNLFARQGSAPTNFSRTLPAPQSELAQQLIKDPYNFDFLTLGPEISERELELGLLEQLRNFFVELGKGFAFVGSQYHLDVGGQDYFIDLLFYHLHLRCFVVIDLKIEDFKPEFAGKMNFYLSAVDDQLRHPADNPSIGLVLCKGKNDVIVEYSLRDANKPMGVAHYLLSPGQALPEQFQSQLPTAAEIAEEMPLLDLVKARIEIERGLQRIAEEKGLSLPRNTAPIQLIRDLRVVGALPVEASELQTALRTMNLAIHGQPVTAEDAQVALEIANQFVAGLTNGITSNGK
jgi:predicted nuclease of restriction endonuclease-like (RecB) superfamily